MIRSNIPVGAERELDAYTADLNEELRCCLCELIYDDGWEEGEDCEICGNEIMLYNLDTGEFV